MTTSFDEHNKVWKNLDFVEPLKTSLGQYVHKKLKQFHQDQVLEVNYDEQEEITVYETLRKATNAAINLKSLGIKKGDVVVFFCQYNSDVVPIFYGCYMIGAIVNCFDVFVDPEKTSHALDILSPSILIYAPEYAEKVKMCSKGLTLFSTDEVKDNILKPNINWESYEPEDLGDPQGIIATVLMSSGTTGAPKMVTLSHALLYNGIQSMFANSLCGQRIFATAPIRWITQYSLLHKPVFNGVVRICTGLPTDSKRLCKIIKEESVTHLVANLNMAYDLFEFLETNNNFQDLNKLQQILLGGDCVPDAMIDIIKEKLPNVLPVKCYGMSELGGIAASNKLCGNTYLNGGSLFSGVSVKILDFMGNSLSYNQNGRIFLNMGIKFLGYYKAEGSINNVFNDNWLETGDYGFMDEYGYINVVGRCKDIIHFNGQEIIASVVQTVLNFHELVKTNIVLGIGVERKPVIFVLLNDKGKQVENVKQILLDFILRSSLDKSILAVLNDIQIMETLPMLSTGKYDKVGLEKYYLEVNC